MSCFSNTRDENYESLIIWHLKNAHYFVNLNIYYVSLYRVFQLIYKSYLTTDIVAKSAINYFPVLYRPFACTNTQII